MDVLQELENAGAVLLDKHFVYKSGKHGSGYINMDPLFPRMSLMIQIARQLRGPFLTGPRVEVVTGPPTGGLLLAAVVAATWPISTFGNVELICPDKRDGGFAFERATFADRLKGKRVLAVEDLLTTGGSVAKVCQEVEEHGGEVIGVSAVCNRGGVTAADLKVPRFATLENVTFDAIDPDDCPLCKAGVPIVDDIGHGDSYKLAHPDYPGGYESLLS
jgi:orotate phosphoribosyltransferase